MARYSLGSVARLFLDIVSSGTGVVSQSPTIAIQRSNGDWFKESDGTWQSAKVENPMVQVSSSNMPGRYEFFFDQSTDLVEGSSSYIAKKSNAGAPVVLEYEDLEFGPLAGTVSPELCSVLGTVYTPQGDPQENVIVRATLEPVFKDAIGRAVQSDKIAATYTNELGDFDLALVRGGTFLLEVAAVGYSRKVLIPDQASVIFTDL